MTTIGFTEKKLCYKVISLDGKELMKFYSRKIALAYAINEDAVLIHNRISQKMRRSERNYSSLKLSSGLARAVFNTQ